MRYFACLILTMLTSCVFSGSDPEPLNNNDATNNATTTSNNATNNETSGTNNATTPTNNRTNNVTVTPTNNGTVTPTNNVVMPECMFDSSIAGQLCDLANMQPDQFPIAGEFDPPPPCETVSCGVCAPSALRGNFCLPELDTLTDPSREWGRSMAMSDRYLVVSPTTAPAPEMKVYDFNRRRFWMAGGFPPPTAPVGTGMAIAGDLLFFNIPELDVIEVQTFDEANEALLPGSGSLLAPTDIEVQTDEWGYALSAFRRGNDTILFVSAPDVNYVNFMFKSDAAEVWTRRPFTEALSPTVPADARYGAALAVDASGTTLAVGAPGLQRVFVWTELGSWMLTDEVAGDAFEFGTAVALNDNGDLLAVGSPRDGNNAGRVQLYVRGANGWDLAADFSGGNASRLGTSVALHGNVMLAGAPGADTLAAYLGTPQIGYIPVGMFSPPGGNLRQGFGRALVVRDGRVAASATNDIDNNQLSGIFLGEFGNGF